MNRTTVRPDWSSLPDHLLAMIAKHLHTRIDALHFRAVCHSFRTSLPLPQHSALNVPVPFDAKDQLSLIHSTVYAIEPLRNICETSNSNTWFVKVRELSSGKVRVEDIFYRSTPKNLSQMLPNSLSLLDYRIKEITKVYGLKFDAHPMEFCEIQYPMSQKVVVSSSCIDEINEGFAIMTVFYRGELGVWRKGDQEWTSIDFRADGICFEDIVYHNEKFYALGSNGLTVTVNSNSLEVTQIVAPGDYANGFNKYLVKSCKDLLFIDECHDYDYCMEECDGNNYPIHLNVFKLDEEKHEWVQVTDSLEDRVLFCSSVCSFSVSAKEFPGCKRDCVYFADAVFSDANDHPGSDAAIFDLEDGTLGPLSCFPGYSDIFWPPPPWLLKNN